MRLNLSNIRLLKITVADGNNSVLKNASIAVPLKYLSNFWLTLDMPLINCKDELELRWTKHCVQASVGVENHDAHSNNIIFTIKGTKLYVPVVTLSAKVHQKLSKLFGKGFEG